MVLGMGFLVKRMGRLLDYGVRHSGPLWNNAGNPNGGGELRRRLVWNLSLRVVLEWYNESGTGG